MTIENASTVICPTEHVEHLLHCIVCYMWDVRTKLQTEIEPVGSNVSALHIACIGANAGHYQDQAYNFARGYLALLNCQRHNAMQDAKRLSGNWHTDAVRTALDDDRKEGGVAD